MKWPLRRQESLDRVLIINGEKIEMFPVIEANESEVCTESHVLPRADAHIKFDPNGGMIYLYSCDLPYLQETQHLKQVEESIVVRNLFDFGGTEKKGDLRFYVMAALLLITIFLLRG
jgi:hypothetical protein